MRIRIYKNSIIASILSVVGYGLIMGGIMMAFGGLFIGGIIVVLIGVIMAFWGMQISEEKQFREWIRKMESNGMVARVKENVTLAVMVYNNNPGKKTVDYISQLNPEAGEMIKEKLHSGKNHK